MHRALLQATRNAARLSSSALPPTHCLQSGNRSLTRLGRNGLLAASLIPTSDHAPGSGLKRRLLHIGAQGKGPVTTGFRENERSAPTTQVEEGTRLRIAVDVDEGEILLILNYSHAPDLPMPHAVLGRFVHMLNLFCKDHYDMDYSIEDYWVYEFAKASYPYSHYHAECYYNAS